MTSLEAVSSYLPAHSVPIDRYLEIHGLSSAQIKLYRRYYGFSHIRLAADSTLAEMMLSAAAKLNGALRGREHQVRYVIQARTVQRAAPYPSNPLAQVRAKLGLEQAISFVVSQHACASGMLGVDLAGRLLAADGDPDALVLLFAGEKSVTPSLRLVPDSVVMGDGMAAVLIRSGGDRDRLLGFATQAHGRFAAAPWLPPELHEEFNALYPVALTEVLRAAVDQAGIKPADISLVLPHNVNRLSWLRVSREMGIPPGKILLGDMSDLGHCFCADAFLNYQRARELGMLQPGDYYVMAAVGLGATFSAMAYQH